MREGEEGDKRKDRKNELLLEIQRKEKLEYDRDLI